MSSFSKSDVATMPGAMPAGRAAHALATGKVKAVNADNQEFVMTDDGGGKEWTFKLGGDVVINRGGKESPTGQESASNTGVPSGSPVLWPSRSRERLRPDNVNQSRPTMTVEHAKRRPQTHSLPRTKQRHLHAALERHKLEALNALLALWR